MKRWLVFNAVGSVGLVVQLATLWTLLRLGLPIAVATALAVMAALSHNFAWHETVTWRGLPRRGRSTRWLKFHAANGIVSLATSVAVTSGIVAATSLPPVAANAIAVAVAAVINYVTSDRLVFCDGQLVPVATRGERMRGTSPFGSEP